MAEAPAARSLPDDVILEILARVKDVSSIFRTATACKRWCRLIVADRSVLPRCLPEDACRPSPFPGFFTRQRRRGRLPTAWFIPAPCPLLGPRRRMLTSFVPGVGARLFDNAVPLASRHGLLLVRLGQDGLDVSKNLMADILLAVCDPLAGTVHVLPPLVLLWGPNVYHHLPGYAMLTAKDCSSSGSVDPRLRRPPFFKVIIITRHVKLMDFGIHTFSSAGESRWHSRSNSLEGEDRGIRATLVQHNAAVCGGAAHWLFSGASGTYTLGVTIDTGRVSFTNVLNTQIRGIGRHLTYDDPYLMVDTKGRLALLCLQKDGRRLQIWASDDDGWSSHDSTLSLEQPDWQTRESGMVYRCLGEMNGTMVVGDNHRRVYATDVNTGVVMQEVTEWPSNLRLHRENTVLMDMDWPAFLASRLRVATK